MSDEKPMLGSVVFGPNTTGYLLLSEEDAKAHEKRMNESGGMLRKKQQRIAAEEAAREKADTESWLADMQARAERELAAWAALPCGGDLKRVWQCLDTFAASCDRRHMAACPRNVMEVERRSLKAARIERRQALAAAGVPVRVLETVYDRRPDRTEAVTKLSDAFKSKPTFVVLSGGVGCGKSCAAGAWLDEQDGIAWVSASKLVTLSPHEGEGRELLRAKHLVIDDLGLEYLDGKGFLESRIDAVVNHRHEEKLPTVITTNLDAKAFRDRYGPRTADRIRGDGVFLVLSGVSLRRKA